jgi:hypothetical protein
MPAFPDNGIAFPMMAPKAAKAVPPKNLRLLASTPRSSAAFFPAMIILPVLSDVRSSLSAGIRDPDRRKYLRFATMPQDRARWHFVYRARSVSIGNAASRAHLRMAVQPPNTMTIFIGRPGVRRWVKSWLNFRHRLAH